MKIMKITFLGLDTAYHSLNQGNEEAEAGEEWKHEASGIAVFPYHPIDLPPPLHSAQLFIRRGGSLFSAAVPITFKKSCLSKKFSRTFGEKIQEEGMIWHALDEEGRGYICNKHGQAIHTPYAAVTNISRGLLILIGSGGAMPRQFADSESDGLERFEEDMAKMEGLTNILINSLIESNPKAFPEEFKKQYGSLTLNMFF